MDLDLLHESVLINITSYLQSSNNPHSLSLSARFRLLPSPDCESCDCGDHSVDDDTFTTENQMPVRVDPDDEDMAMLVEYKTCFFHMDDPEEFYEDSVMSKDLFKKFELHTPPQSPPHNPFPPDQTINATDIDNCLRMASKALEAGDSWSPFENPLSNLIQDCMWSEPSLAAAGLLTPQQKKTKAKSPASPVPMDTSNNAHAADINSSECVSPAAVFPYPGTARRDLSNVRKIDPASLGSFAETPSPSESGELVLGNLYLARFVLAQFVRARFKYGARFVTLLRLYSVTVCVDCVL